MGDTPRDEQQALSRVTDLKQKVQQAAALIGELREANYALNGEVAELKRELDARPEIDAEAASSNSAADDNSEAAEDNSALSAELDALREQRQTIRDKVAMLLERIEKLET